MRMAQPGFDKTKSGKGSGRMGAWIIFLTSLLAGLSFVWADGPLTFEDRVKAQEAIERVYYSHRIWPKENPGPKPPFEQMITRQQIESKVEDYLKKSVALDKFWQRPLTADQLQAEMDRMAKQTKDPDTLLELFAALNNDPHLIAECLARPILADRLIRNWYAFDARFHGELKREAEALRVQLTSANFASYGAERFNAVRIELVNAASAAHEPSFESKAMRLEADEYKKAAGEYPEEGAISQVIETAEAYLIRWTESKT